jgi:hypothetical protein
MFEISFEILVPASSGILWCHGQCVHSIAIVQFDRSQSVPSVHAAIIHVAIPFGILRLYVNGLRNLAANWFHLVCPFLLMADGFHIANWDKKMLF